MNDDCEGNKVLSQALAVYLCLQYHIKNSLSVIYKWNVEENRYHDHFFLVYLLSLHLSLIGFNLFMWYNRADITVRIFTEKRD